jgi:hypothetical protein
MKAKRRLKLPGESPDAASELPGDAGAGGPKTNRIALLLTDTTSALACLNCRSEPQRNSMKIAQVLLRRLII